MKDPKDPGTIDFLSPSPSKRGPKPSGLAKSRAQIQREYRDRQRLQLQRLRWLEEHFGPALPCPPDLDEKNTGL